MPQLSTVLSIEGGPGYPTAADRDARADVWRPVSDRSDLPAPSISAAPGESGALVMQGVRELGLRTTPSAGDAARRSSGPDRDLYSTSQAPVQDLEAVLRAVGAGKVDLYGDSYGSYQRRHSPSASPSGSGRSPSTRLPATRDRILRRPTSSRRDDEGSS